MTSVGNCSNKPHHSDNYWPFGKGFIELTPFCKAAIFLCSSRDVLASGWWLRCLLKTATTWRRRRALDIATSTSRSRAISLWHPEECSSGDGTSEVFPVVLRLSGKRLVAIDRSGERRDREAQHEVVIMVGKHLMLDETSDRDCEVQFLWQ
jgi:hypothetical protein